MPRSPSAVLQGTSSKAVKSAEKSKSLKADLKAALKAQTTAVKALAKADDVVAKLQLKLAKLETPKVTSTEKPVAPPVTFTSAAVLAA